MQRQTRQTRYRWIWNGAIVRRRRATILLLVVVAGCGRSTTLSGSVTYDGRPVPRGSITLRPADGRGPAAGGEIVAGKYALANLTPGKKIVHIVGFLPAGSLPNGAKASRQAAEGRGRANPVLDRGNLVPHDAVGNDQPVTIEPGPQSRDFHLEPPSSDGPSAERA